MENETKKKGGREKAEAKVTEGGTTPSETIAVAATAPVAEEPIAVKKSDLDDLIRRLDAVEADNRRLREAADKSRMSAIAERERQERKGLTQVRINAIDGKLIVAWNMTRNESFVQGRVLVEHQEIEVFYIDGTSERMPYIDFFRNKNKDTVAEIVSRSKNEGTGEEVLHVRVISDGRELDIAGKFVN
jgi:hypothetical protein